MSGRIEIDHRYGVAVVPPRVSSGTIGIENVDGYKYREFSELTGPFVEPEEDYKVRYVSIMTGLRRVCAYVLAGAAFTCELTFLAWLVQPAHWPRPGPISWQYYISLAMIASIAIVEGLRLLNIGTLALATLHVRDPQPVREVPGTRVAFLTTIVPSREPIEMAERTLEAALKIRHDGPFDVWLLDEGNDPEIRTMCARLGVHHFSRSGIDRYNQPSGSFKHRCKHGNYNAWLDSFGHMYEFWVSVDTDHVPHPNMAERLLGYFRDPDVAFVVGPQVYGNYDNFVTKAAESQQFLFHGVVQRAGNHLSAAMFVGTNNAVRISALRQIGGLVDSITEDMATSIMLHGTVNEETGHYFTSVYTPDVLAVGEGPSSWTDYFIQQGRWSRGTDEVVVRKWKDLGIRHLPRRRLIHYFLLMGYYPSAALGWMFGSLNIALSMTTGVVGLSAGSQLWIMLYTNAAVLQLGIYTWNRQFNVSPHEERGSSGLLGMVMSAFTAPMYVDAFIQAVRNRAITFEITPKGEDGTKDQLRSFSRNLFWVGFLIIALALSFLLHNDRPMMREWAFISLVICVAPLFIWRLTVLRARLVSRARLKAQRKQHRDQGCESDDGCLILDDRRDRNEPAYSGSSHR